MQDKEHVRKILVVDDEKNIAFVIKAILERGSFKVDSCSNVESAEAALKPVNHGYCAVITDLYMPGKTGMQFLSELKVSHPELPVIMVTAFGTVESAVEALKKGAFDYLTKPFEQDEILAIAEKAANTYYLRRQEPVGSVSENQLTQSVLVGKSHQIKDVWKMIHKIAASPTTVLVTGESGTGKELVALAIHRNSDRSQKPFIKINCAAIPHTLIESELFGYEKGAFTGAMNTKPGRFELAHEGTLFLDEVAEMPLEMQVKLLRAIQESEFERVGGLQTVKIDVRIIAATNRDLMKAVKEGSFREDLYYRLNVVPLQLAPLRERKIDIEDLVYFFIRKFNEKLNKEITTIDPQCMESLLLYSWPGNIRQLENVLERAVLMSETSELRVQDLPEEITRHDGDVRADGSEHSTVLQEYRKGEAFKDIVKRQTQVVEKEIIEQALMQNEKNITKTAEKLGLSRKGLQLKLKELGIQVFRYPKEGFKEVSID